MNSFESQLTEAKLLAEFTPDQQVFVDKLIAEYLKKFRGVKDAELKARFEKGDREALKIYREMIAKRQQILDFINKKDERDKMRSIEEKQKRFESFEVGDKVLVVSNEEGDVRDAIIANIEKKSGNVKFVLQVFDDQERLSISDPNLLLHLEEEDEFYGNTMEPEYFEEIEENKIFGFNVGDVYVNNFNGLEYRIVGFGYFFQTVNVIYSLVTDEYEDKDRQSIESFKSNFKKIKD